LDQDIEMRLLPELGGPPMPESELKASLSEFSEIIVNVHERLQCHNNELASHLSFKFMEAQFIKAFLEFQALAKRDVQRGFAPSDISISDLPNKIHELYDLIVEYSSDSKQNVVKDEIIWFNVRGESVCLLKSTILEVIAIAVSMLNYFAVDTIKAGRFVSR
jgi:hypothetical protein